MAALGLRPEGVALVMSYPKRTLTLAEHGGLSLEAAGLNGRREALFLQPLSGAAAGADPGADPVAATAAGAVEGAMDEDSPGLAPLLAPPAGGSAPEPPHEAGPPSPGSAAWASAAALHASRLDRALSSEAAAGVEAAGDEAGSAPEVDRVAAFHSLVAAGLGAEAAGRAAQRWTPQLAELSNMGLLVDAAQVGECPGKGGERKRLRVTACLHQGGREGWVRVFVAGGLTRLPLACHLLAQNKVSEAVSLLDRYNGRMLRVVNALSERPLPLEPAPVSPPLGAAAPTPNVGTAPGAQESFQARFEALLAAGADVNEAAAQALIAFAAPEASPAPPPGSAEGAVDEAAMSDVGGSSGSGVGPAPYSAELAELAAMGFDDREANIALLDRYQGRLVRVVNFLAGGD